MKFQTSDITKRSSVPGVNITSVTLVEVTEKNRPSIRRQNGGGRGDASVVQPRERPRERRLGKPGLRFTPPSWEGLKNAAGPVEAAPCALPGSSIVVPGG